MLEKRAKFITLTDRPMVPMSESDIDNHMTMFGKQLGDIIALHSSSVGYRLNKYFIIAAMLFFYTLGQAANNAKAFTGRKTHVYWYT